MVVPCRANKVNPEWVALNKSRGHESLKHKLFMRYTGNKFISQTKLYFLVQIESILFVLVQTKGLVGEQAIIPMTPEKIGD